MRRLVHVLIAVIVALPAGAACSRLSSADLAAIRSIDAAYANAWLQNDRSAVVALFTKDAVIVPQNHDAITGLDAIEKFWWPPDGGKTTVTSFDSATAEAAGCGDMAFTRGSYHFTFVYDAQKSENRGNYMMLMRRTAKGWKITHRMWSDRRPQ